MAITALFGFWGYWCPYLQPGGLLGYLGFSTSSSPSPRQLQSLGLHYDRLHRPCQVWPHIRPWGPSIASPKASILDYLTGEYPGVYGLDISGLAAHAHCLPVLRGYCGGIVEFIAARWCGLPSQQVIVGTRIKRQHNLVFVLHLFAFLLHSMPWPLRGLLMHHGIHGPRVAFV